MGEILPDKDRSVSWFFNISKNVGQCQVLSSSISCVETHVSLQGKCTVLLGERKASSSMICFQPHGSARFFFIHVVA